MSGSAQALAMQWPARITRRLEDSHALLAGVLLVVLSALLMHATVSTFTKRKYDVDGASVSIAAQMLGVTKEKRQIGAPGYPLALYALARTDESVASAIACKANGGGTCEPAGSFRSVVAVQFMLVVVSLALVFLLALRLSGLWEAGLLTLLLTCLESRLGEFAASISPLSWTVALTLLYSALALEAYLRGSLVFALAAGAAVGLAALFAPLTLVVAPALAVLFFVARGRAKAGTAFLMVLGFLAGLLAAAGLGALAVKLSYDLDAGVRLMTLRLSERVGFEGMGPVAWIAGLVLPIPFLGGWLEFLFPDAVADKLAYGFTADGRSTVLRQAFAQPGSALDQYWWLVRTYVIDAAGSYLAVTPPILNRGMWGGGGIVALIGIFSIPRAVSLHRAHCRGAAFAVVFVPVVCLLAASVLSSANQFTNVPLLSFAFAYVVAYATARFPEAVSGSD